MHVSEHQSTQGEGGGGRGREGYRTKMEKKMESKV